jgi:16S rRNA processing protein RimM
MDVTEERLVVIGEVSRVHGLRGEVRVRPMTDRPERFERLSGCVVWDESRNERRLRRIVSTRPHGDVVLVLFEDVNGPEQAAHDLVGRLLAVPESQALPLPEGSFYPWQLENALVVTEDGRELGRIAGIEQGAQELWIVSADGREHLIPAVPEIVLDVDIAARRVVIRPPDGLLEL